MTRVNPFKGLGVALVTPFKKDGSVDYKRLETLVNDLIENETDFLCVLGTTAETPCLTAKEKAEIIDTVRRVNAGRVPLLLGCGGNCTENVCQYLQETNLSGIDGVLIVAPYYNKPTQEGLYRHFIKVAAATPLPVVLYNVPGRTGVNIEAETTIRIANDCPNVVAIKEASGKVAQIGNILDHAPEGFEVISGDDSITYELLTMGATGVISVVGNAYPRRFAEMVHKTLAQDLVTGQTIHQELSPLFPLLSIEGNPAGVKALLAIQGKAENELRLPIVPVSEQTYRAIADLTSDKYKG